MMVEPKGNGVALRTLDLEPDTVTGKLMLNDLRAVAQFERETMLERQGEGIAKAKKEGKYQGRASTARRMAEGNTKRRIAGLLGISGRSGYRII